MARAGDVWMLVRDIFSAIYVLETRKTTEAQRYYIKRMIKGHIDQLKQIERDTGKDPVSIIESSFGDMVQALDRLIEENS